MKMTQKMNIFKDVFYFFFIFEGKLLSWVLMKAITTPVVFLILHVGLYGR